MRIVPAGPFAAIAVLAIGLVVAGSPDADVRVESRVIKGLVPSRAPKAGTNPLITPAAAPPVTAGGSSGSARGRRPTSPSTW